MVSLNVTLPDDVSYKIRFLRVSSPVKAYRARGFGLALMNSMLSSILFNCFNNTSDQRIYGCVKLLKGYLVILTVIIGNRGPKISSVMISA